MVLEFCELLVRDLRRFGPDQRHGYSVRQWMAREDHEGFSPHWIEEFLGAPMRARIGRLIAQVDAQGTPPGQPARDSCR